MAMATATLPTEILDRLPPQNLEAEKGVLGSLLLDPELCDEVVFIVRPEDFYADANERLFRHLLALHEEGKRPDAVLLIERLQAAGELDAVGGPAYIAEVAQSVPYASNAAYYARIVRDKSTLRALIHAGTEILRDAYEPSADPEQITSQAEQKVFAVHDERTTNQVTDLPNLMLEAFDLIDARLEGRVGMGVPTGFPDLDNLTGGMHESELVILAARPSMGKTALALNMAEHVAVESRVPVLFVSLEMAKIEVAQRLLCSAGRIDSSKFRSLILSSKDRGDLVKASNKLGDAPLFIDDTPTRTVTEIAACARRLKRSKDLGLVVVDYLQLIQPDNARDPRQEQVARIARRLKGLARELKIPVLCLAQLNRQADPGPSSSRRSRSGESDDPEASKSRNWPRLSQLRESGAIEQDADVVMFIHREEVFLSREEARQRDLAGRADLIVAKQRNGARGNIHLFWREQNMRFESVSSRDEESPHYHDEFNPYADEGETF
jgi:replicative DNA helicase